MYEDAFVIAKEAEKLADHGKDVILMGHSYAGIPMSQCTKHLGKEDRKAQGKPGGIVRLAYMSALVPPVGGSAGSLLGRFPNDNRPPVHIDDNVWMLMADPAATAAMVVQDLPPAEGEAFIKGFAKHSACSFGDELTHAGYKDIPASSLLCEDDQAGPAPFQREIIAMIEEASGRPVQVTSVASRHCPSLTAEKETLQWVVQVINA